MELSRYADPAYASDLRVFSSPLSPRPLLSSLTSFATAALLPLLLLAAPAMLPVVPRQTGLWPEETATPLSLQACLPFAPGCLSPAANGWTVDG